MAIQALSEKSDRILHFLSMTMDEMKKESYWEDVSLVTNSSALSSKKKKGKSKKKHKKRSSNHSQTTKSASAHPRPTRILQLPRIAGRAVPTYSVGDAKMQSFSEYLGLLFPPHIYPALVQLGVSTVDDTHFLSVEDLMSSPNITRVQARKLLTFFHHHHQHGEYPRTITPNVHFTPAANSIPVKSKYAKDLPKFSGWLEDWIRWKEESIAVLGHNDWLKVANHGTISTDPQFIAINNSLYWALLHAVQFGEAQNKVKVHQNSAFGEPNGNGAWRELVSWYETSHATEIMTNSILQAIEALSFKDSSSQTVGVY